MITQLIRLGAIIATGRFLKPRIKGLICIALVWIVLWFVHSEYVSYVQLSGNTNFVLKASLIKAALYALSILVYVLLVERKLWPKPVKIPPTASNITQTPTSSSQHLTSDDDGFDFLRNKKELKNQAKELLKK